VGPGDVVAVIGLGAVGLQAVMCALAMGASRVLAIDLLPNRVEQAEELGAEGVAGPDTVAGVMEMTKGCGADVVIDANGGPVTTALAVDLIGKGGRVSLVGISEMPTIPFPIAKGIFKNIEFHAGICSVQPKSLSLCGNWKVAGSAAQLWTGSLPSDGPLRGNGGLCIFDARKDGVLKVALDPAL